MSVSRADARVAAVNSKNVNTKNARAAANSSPITLGFPMPGATSRSRYLKRVLDGVSAGVLLVVLSPVLAVAAVAVAATSPGGALFVQRRVGRDKKQFKLYKFRTMTAGTFDQVMQSPEQRARYESNGFKLEADDQRITKVGRWLRRSSLDELPQLVNVIKGDMSLVGIRPLLDVELAQRPRFDQECYAAMRPGLTGSWQVEGRSSVTGHARVALDRDYVLNWSLWADLWLLLRTPRALLRPGNSQ